MGAFEGKVVLITGASSGLGEAMARVFAEEGASLVLAARREERLKALAGELAGAGRQAVVVRCDVTVDGDVERAVEAACDAFGHLDVAVANAGFGVVGSFERLTLDDFRRQFETNVFGVLRTAKAALPELKKSKGILVLVGSVSGHVGTPGASPYTMSKFAVRGLAASLYPELARDGVSVVLISPGYVETDIRKVDRFGRLHPDAKDPVPGWLRMPARVAAKQIVRAVAARRREAVITLHGKAAVIAERLFPCIVAWSMRRTRIQRKAPKE